jgi:hypothetical protein
MYYSDNNYDIDKKHKIDKLILYNTEHNMKHKYKLDTFLKKSLDYKSNDDYEKEILKYKEEMYNIEKPILEYKIQYLSKMYPINRLYVEDPTNIKYYGDIEFYKWLYMQNDPKLAVFAELVHAPKLNDSIEKMRAKVKDLDTISIDNFKKIKKLGCRQIEFIKKLKKKYGNYILKFLNLYA